MILKIKYWLLMLGLLVSGLSYAVPIQTLSLGNGVVTELILEEKQEAPAAGYIYAARTPAVFTSAGYKDFYFPFFLDLQQNIAQLQLKLQKSIFSELESIFLEQKLSARLAYSNLLIH
ncbi:hypothetical protein FHG64_13245 [Antarcticibacterium flavum]|uniref:Uncharacterized protein n=1 Tax=Antarcticibacterium flavum TaxID=2058175 RepID=A0A5B7X6D0_9FLAO|nr:MULTISPECIES: hypothetical protein [Antarcticibacterium]MCM4158546.1 hypothetical protein [Antarcticibacterium sp. W02-3]QCY70292.1 hypothetical protein FHG64_13245 [Antarcticibacterium flavum]